MRGNDLRFQPEEAGHLFNAVLYLGLADDDVELLYRRTEGWAAGLYLAALSLSGRSDADAVIKTFDGDHRYIADYLMAEVLDCQPEKRRRFLLRTSILRNSTAHCATPCCTTRILRRCSRPSSARTCS